MAREPIGIEIIEDEAAVGAYEVEDGLEAFEADGPYLMADGKSLQAPVPVQIVDGPVYADAMGNACAAIPITLPDED